jgi:lipoate synthase
MNKICRGCDYRKDKETCPRPSLGQRIGELVAQVGLSEFSISPVAYADDSDGAFADPVQEMKNMETNTTARAFVIEACRTTREAALSAPAEEQVWGIEPDRAEGEPQQLRDDQNE